MTAAASRADVEELYRRHAGEIRGYLHRRAGQPGADLLGDVFVVALQRLDELPEPDLRRAWLFGTARRLLLSAQRKERQRQDAEHEHARLREPEFVDPGGEHSGRARLVRDAITSLRERDRELIRLTEWEGLGIAEAALVLRLRPGTARVRLHRARRALATHPALARLLDPPPEPDPAPSGVRRPPQLANDPEIAASELGRAQRPTHRIDTTDATATGPAFRTSSSLPGSR